MTIITAWSALVVVGSNSRGGVQIPFDQRACVVVWVVASCGELSGWNGLEVKSSLVTQCFLLRGPRLKLNVLFIGRLNKHPQSQ